MAWRIEGRYFENCSCDMPCPCTVTIDAGADLDRCNAFLVFHVERGEIDGVDVGGVTVAVIVDSPKVMADGGWRLGILVDEGASANVLRITCTEEGVFVEGAPVALEADGVHVAVAEAELRGSACAHDEQAFLHSEVLSERRSHGDELDIAPGTGMPETDPVPARPQTLPVGEHERCPEGVLASLHDEVVIIAAAQDA